MAKANRNLNEDRYTRGIIRRKVKQLIGRAGFTKQDREDLEQDLLVRVLQSMPRFDEDQAHFNKFVTAVVERYVANILRNKKAEKRDHRRVKSLNVTIDVAEEGATEFAQTIGDRELDARLCRQRRTDEELSQLGDDLAILIATLPDDWQTMLKLRKSRPMAEVAREMDLPRTTLVGWMKQIRQRFEDAGLRDYLR